MYSSGSNMAASQETRAEVPATEEIVKWDGAVHEPSLKLTSSK